MVIRQRKAAKGRGSGVRPGKDTISYLSYRAIFAPATEPGFLLASFPDLPEAVVEAAGEAEIRARARLALTETLRGRLAARQPFFPSAPPEEGELIPVDPALIAKLALVTAFMRSGMTPSELARRMGASEHDAHRVLDPLDPTPLTLIGIALAALGQAIED